MHSRSLGPSLVIAVAGAAFGSVADQGDCAEGQTICSDAFAQPLDGLSAEQRMDFALGRALFERLWVAAPSSTRAADGLGPLYNARSCLSCHPGNGRGRPPESSADKARGLLLRIDVPAQDETQRRMRETGRIANVPDPVYGLQLQPLSIAGQSAEFRLDYAGRESVVIMKDGETVGLFEPVYGVAEPGYGPLHPQARLSPRLSPQLIGLGLLEAIDESDILALADPEDDDGDGISGRANSVWSRQQGKVMTGRYGHKAGMATLDDQNQSAFANDLGLSVPLYPDGAGECTERQTICRNAPHGGSPQYDGLEAHAGITDLVGFYVRHLAAPSRRSVDDTDVKAGEALFHKIGCAGCHVDRFVTPKDAGPSLANRVIQPYTDLLLHDMGEGLADHRPEGEATGREWRTPPLWGIGLAEHVNGHAFYLHDGRARSLLEAVLWHGGEAQTQRDAVARLSKTDRDLLIRFLESL